MRRLATTRRLRLARRDGRVSPSRVSVSAARELALDCIVGVILFEPDHVKTNENKSYDK